MTIPADLWLNALLSIKLKSDKTVDTLTLAQNLTSLAPTITGYKNGFSLPDESPTPTNQASLPLTPATMTTILDTFTKLNELLNSARGLVKVLQKPSSLTAPGTAGDYYVDLETSVVLPPMGPTVNFIYICLVSGNWIKLIVVP